MLCFFQSGKRFVCMLPCFTECIYQQRIGFICSITPIRLRASQGQEENLLLLSLIRARGWLGILSLQGMCTARVSPVSQAQGAMRALMSGLVNELQHGRERSDAQTDSGYV